MEKWTSGEAYEGWVGRWSRLLADEFIDWLGIPPAQCWLDVCCGSGALSEVILARCSPARLEGIDASPAQIAYANQHRGRPQARFQVADARALPFSAHSFDVAVCGLGLNFVGEAKQAVREMRRVSRTDATLAAYVLDYREGARFVREFWDAAIAVDPEALAFDQGRHSPLCTPAGLRNLFGDTGLKDVEVRALHIVTRFADFDEYWAPFLSEQGCAPNYLASRGEQVRNAICERLRTSLSSSDGAIELPARAWAVRGRS